MAVLGLLFIVLSFFFEDERIHMAMPMLIAGSILAAGACIGGAIQQGKS
jgi:hypothetical protein